MKTAIIQAGSSQKRVEEGGVVEVDRLPNEVGDSVIYDVLFVNDDGKVRIGTPLVDGVQVTATVLEHFRGPKIRVFKYKPKVRQRKTKGHRQEYTRLKVESIGAPGGGKKRRSKKADTAADETPAPEAAGESDA